jgi:hypothetical protein
MTLSPMASGESRPRSSPTAVSPACPIVHGFEQSAQDCGILERMEAGIGRLSDPVEGDGGADRA